MYFEDRHVLGAKMASKLWPKYKYHNTAVLALSEGGLLVGYEVARMLHSSLSLLLTQDIKVPGESAAVGEIDEMGTFTYNRMYSAGQLEAFEMEYLNHLEQEKRTKLGVIHRMMAKGGFLRPEILENHIIFVVVDGANSGVGFDVALSFLKPIKTKKIVAVVGIASLDAVDQLHIHFDDLITGSVVENYFDADHYFDKNDMPERGDIIRMIENIPLYWEYPKLPNKSIMNRS